MRDWDFVAAATLTIVALWVVIVVCVLSLYFFGKLIFG